MTDYFAVLGEPRRPWLDVEQLKQKFLEASGRIHPDRVHTLGEAQRATAQEQYTKLNAAYHCLREPRERLRHLLELERGPFSKDAQPVPSELMELSLQVGQLCRETDTFLSAKAKVSSPLLRVQMFEESHGWTDKLQTLQRVIGAKSESVIESLKELDAQWNCATADEARRLLFLQLEEAHRLLGYFGRWDQQLRERMARLAF